MQMNLKRMLHLNGIKRTLNLFLINHVFVGTKPLACNMKRKLLRGIGCPVGDGTTIVGPIECKGTIAIGNNCWIGPNVTIQGPVIIEDGAVVAPGSVVNKSVPKGAIVAGTPARIIGFTNELNYDIMKGESWDNSFRPFLTDKRLKNNDK